MLNLYITRSFDFSIPLDKNRIILLRECINRYNSILLSNSVNSMLLSKLVQINALVSLKDPEAYIDNALDIKQHLMSFHSSDVFPYEKNEEDIGISNLRKQYIEYINALESGAIKQQNTDERSNEPT